MVDASSVVEIIATYQKYGWILRRVLLTKTLAKKHHENTNTLFGDVPIIDAGIDAAWFSRPPKGGGVAWELRYLGDIPFALLENIDESNPAFENILGGVELRLSEAISAKTSARQLLSVIANLTH